MGTRKLFLLILIIIAGCNEDDQPLEPTYIELLAGRWQLEEVRAAGETYVQMDGNYELLGLEQVDISNQTRRRFFIYNENYSYVIEWQPDGQYQLGTEGTDNWQPSEGFFDIDGVGNITHNRGMEYEQTYTFVLEGNTLQRRSTRYMVNCSPVWTGKFEDRPLGGLCERWDAGDYVEIVEYFIKVDD